MMSANKTLNISLIFLVVGLISCIFSDFSISTLEPFLETKKFFSAIFEINFNNTDFVVEAILNTISIAVIAIFVSSVIGFVFAIFFQNFLLRITLAFTRSIHEIFWALIFLQIFGLNTLSALLAITIPYSAILGKVYAEILEENVIIAACDIAENSTLVIQLFTTWLNCIPLQPEEPKNAFGPLTGSFGCVSAGAL